VCRLGNSCPYFPFNCCFQAFVLPFFRSFVCFFCSPFLFLFLFLLLDLLLFPCVCIRTHCLQPLPAILVPTTFVSPEPEPEPDHRPAEPWYWLNWVLPGRRIERELGSIWQVHAAFTTPRPLLQSAIQHTRETRSRRRLHGRYIGSSYLSRPHFKGLLDSSVGPQLTRRDVKFGKRLAGLRRSDGLAVIGWEGFMASRVGFTTLLHNDWLALTMTIYISTICHLLNL